MRMTLTWLAYLTRENYDRRIQNFLVSMQSLQHFKNEDVDLVIVDNSEHDNDATIKLRDVFLPQVPIFKAANEWCDVAAHFVSYYLCENFLFGYSYDDFVFYDHNFISNLRKFFTYQSNAHCCRIAKYDVNQEEFYDANITSKDINPEAVRKNNTKNNQPFQKKGPFISDDMKHEFYECNWRPTSRPAVWDYNAFEKLITPFKFSKVPTLQQFEKFMYDACDNSELWESAFLNKGACFTFPQSTSVRISAGLGITKSSPVVDLNELQRAINDKSRWK